MLKAPSRAALIAVLVLLASSFAGATVAVADVGVNCPPGQTPVEGPRTMAEIVGHHLRNVEVHHVDLDIGYLPSDWPAELVDAELPRRLRSLPGRAPDADLLAWLLGRAPAPELTGPW